ncbi:MAG: DUF3293 domain-containing protein [Zoogloeaceae bacterium]|jgi:hypothetical protein|nr:DUF3293 domain-containing protein [Zoogloeaceae bacterium]
MTRDVTLEHAYRATAYHVRLPAGELVLRVDEPAPRLDGWLAGEGVACWGVLTAWNPASKRLSVARNRPRQAALRHVLQEQGYRIFPGEHHSAGGDWPLEPTFFILSLPQNDALDLARRFGQNAFLWGERGGCPQLFWGV